VVPFAADAGGDAGERVTADAGDSAASCALPRPSPAATGDVSFGATGTGDAEAGVAVEWEGDTCAYGIRPSASRERAKPNLT
jgi:hypothetical protein